MTQVKNTPIDCPVCGRKPTPQLSKKTGCQLHGEPIQYAILACTNPTCPGKPSVTGGDIFNGGKSRAEEGAILLWNHSFPHVQRQKEIKDELLREIKWGVAVLENKELNADEDAVLQAMRAAIAKAEGVAA